MQRNEVIIGTLLGDGCVFLDRGKYARYKLTAKDKHFVDWVGKLLLRVGLKVYTTSDKRNKTHILYSSTNSLCTDLRSEWYKKINGRTQKVIPKDLKFTPNTLLFWYLGDGSLIRHKNPNRVPCIVLATTNFSKKDINFLIKKLRELELNFYPVMYKSGFTGKECGYCLYSNIQDGTPFRFFQIIGFEPPKEIANCITGRKGESSKLHRIKDKWPTEEDWIKILSNVKEAGKFFKQKRLEMGLSQRELAKLIGCSREHVRDVENCKHGASVKYFKIVLKALNLNVPYLLKELKVGS